MKFTLKIDSDNEACKTRYDLSEILSNVAESVGLHTCCDKRAILDINGNTVGYQRIEDAEETEDEEEVQVSYLRGGR